MKKLILLFTILFSFGMVQSQDVIRYQLATNDTLEDADTLSAVYPGIISGLYYYSVQVVADSVDGTPAGTINLQQGNHTTPEKWTNVGTAITLGTGAVLTQNKLYESTTPFLGSKLRIYVLHSGTGKDAINAYLVLKKVK
jgi:hypothetical protein